MEPATIANCGIYLFKRIENITRLCVSIPPQFVNLDFLRMRASKGTLEILAGETMLCFECGGSLQQKSGELVCKGCGVVWGNGVFEDNRVPFEVKDGGAYEGHWSPPNELAFNANTVSYALRTRIRNRNSLLSSRGLSSLTSLM